MKEEFEMLNISYEENNYESFFTLSSESPSPSPRREKKKDKRKKKKRFHLMLLI